MKTLVAYYSLKGSNEFLANRIAGELGSDMERIRPRLNGFMLLMMNMMGGNRPFKSKLEDYDHVIMVGPIFMGKFIPPLKGFATKYKDRIKNLVFVTCCGSTYKQKDDKFGHGLVFRELEGIMDGKCSMCQAFPIGLVLPDDQKEDTDAFMKTHLNEENFKGEIRERYDAFMLDLKDLVKKS